MNRQEKQVVIDSLKDNFSNCTATFLVGVEGLTVSQFQSLRKGLREQGGKMIVAKNTLLKVAVGQIDAAKGLLPHFSKQLAVIFATQESPAVAKVVFDAAKDNENLKILSGSLEGQVIDAAKVKYLATLPSRDQLLGRLCGVLVAPIAAHVRLLNMVVVQFLFVLKQASEKEQ
jgi:large subunit ribosomal protein L10